MLYKLAVEKAGSFDSNAIREALASMKDVTSLITASTFSMDETGTGIKALTIVRAEGGQWVFDAIVEP